MAFIDELTTELDGDPLTLGYAAAGWTGTPPTSAQYQAVADIINDATLRTRDRKSVPASEILAAVTPAQYLTVFQATGGSAGDQTHRRYWEDMMNSGDTVDLDNPNIRTALTTIFAGQTSTLNALLALQTEGISRADELGLRLVTVGDLKLVKGDV